MSAEGRRGVAVYIAIVLAGVSVVAWGMHALELSVSDGAGMPFVLLAMWMPALARLVATRTVDREWRSPFPLGRWGTPPGATLLVPFLAVLAIYLAAYIAAGIAGVEKTAAAWTGERLVLNVAINLPLLSLLGMVGAFGEELGWRGYLQPRLDSLGVSRAVLLVIVVETLFHVPMILLAGYVSGDRPLAAMALFFGLGLGLTPIWTWATYRWNSLWIAVWFHTFHNALSQTILPKALGAGDPLVLGESGIFPVASYLLAAVAIYFITRTHGGPWPSAARGVRAIDR